MNDEIAVTLRSIIKEELKPIQGQIGQITQRLDRMDQRMDRMEQRMDGMDQRMDRMEQRMDGIDQRMDRMEQRMDGIERDIQDLKAVTSEIPAIKQAVFETSDRLKHVEENMVTKDDIRYIDTKIGQHDREIFKIKNA